VVLIKKTRQKMGQTLLDGKVRQVKYILFRDLITVHIYADIYFHQCECLYLEINNQHINSLKLFSTE